MGKTILIVDDEAFIRTELKERIDWQKHGYTRILEADNGKNALVFCERRLPDLIVTDIRMPVMDGLVLCSELKRLDRNAKIIILSSYVDFEYVREALKIGVVDYLPKHEMNDYNVSFILEKINNDRDGDEKLFDSLGKSVYLRHYIMGLSNVVPANFNARPYKFQNSQSTFVFIQLEIEPELPSKRGGAAAGDYKNEYEKTVCSHLDQHLEEYNGEYTDFYENKLWIIAQFPYSSSQSSTHFQVTQLLHGIHSCLNHCLPLGISLYYHYAAGDVKDLPDFFNLLKERDSKRIHHRNEIVHAASSTKAILPIMRNHSGINELQVYLREHNLQKVNEVLRVIWLKEAPQLCEAEINRLYCDAVDALLDCLFRNKLPEIEQSLTQTTINDFTTYEGIHEWFQHIAAQLLGSRYLFIKKIDNEKLRSITNYIQNHLNSDLSLKVIADLFGLNKNYLSEIFKLKLGINYSKYIIQIRILHAEHLLLQTDLPVKDISKAIGYEDPAYFIKLFNKITGLSPAGFRKQNRLHLV
jgi:two-component system response regulator YesN